MSPLTPTLVLLLATAAMASTSSEWVKYKLQQEELYSEEEDAVRMKIWMKNVAMVEKHNSEKHNYTLAINKFSDWTKEEFNNLLGYRPRILERSNIKTFANVKTPSRVDFRQEGLVTPVKEHGHDGKCWAYSAAGAIEGVRAKNTGQLVPLSAQQLVDCVPGTDCRTGRHNICAWDHVIQVGGIQSQESYTAHDGQCHEDPSQFVANISGYQVVNSNELQLESALVQIGHPISIGVHADTNWSFYHRGVYDDLSCKNGDINHAVLLVGYDKSGPQPYWIVKNNWGHDWGENGYIKLKMGQNTCGLISYPCYPTI